MVAVKVCGITDPVTLKAAVRAGANYIGLMFYPPSPRYVDIAMAQALSGLTPDNVKTVGVFVNPGDGELIEITGKTYLDMIQLHGDESPRRVEEIRDLTGLPVIKAFRVGSREDLHDVAEFEDAADWLLFDARSEKAGVRGGSGERFNWDILQGFIFKKPWMLSGGISVDNVLDALAGLKPDALDLSSSLETSPGKKNPEKIIEFFDVLKKSGKLRPSYLARLK